MTFVSATESRSNTPVRVRIFAQFRRVARYHKNIAKALPYESQVKSDCIAIMFLVPAAEMQNRLDAAALFRFLSPLSSRSQSRACPRPIGNIHRLCARLLANLYLFQKLADIRSLGGEISIVITFCPAASFAPSLRLSFNIAGFVLPPVFPQALFQLPSVAGRCFSKGLTAFYDLFL